MKRSADERPSLFRTGLKLLFCGALIAAIGFAIAVLGTTGSVSESHADVAWLSPFERSHTERFNAALDHLGHDEPQRYDLNGNVVYFSTNTSRKSPRQLMAEYQEEFQNQGLNDRIYVDLDQREYPQRIETALTGGLVPFAISDEQIALRGMITANKATSSEELAEVHQEADSLGELFRGHRYIEISRPSDSRHTSIVASWSDEAFDYERMIPGSRATGQGFDSTVPSCPGCTRLNRFADDNPATSNRSTLSFIGPRGLQETRDYYIRTLAHHGWSRQGLDEPIHALEDQFGFSVAAPGTSDVFYRQGERLTLTFTTDQQTGHTLTLASHTDS